MNTTDAAGGVVVHATPGPRPAEVPVVIVPGIGMSHRYSTPLHEALGRSRTVLSLDLPGFAGMPRPAQPMSVTAYAEAVARALSGRGIRRSVVVGHSMGAQFAVELARLHPELVDRLVLAAPVVDPHRRTAWHQGLDLLRDLFVETPAASAVVVSDYLRTGPRWFFTALRTMLDYRTDEAIRSVTCPVLVVRGENDPIARREWCSDLAHRAAGGELLEVAGGGHVLQHTEPHALAAAITAFAARATQNGAR